MTEPPEVHRWRRWRLLALLQAVVLASLLVWLAVERRRTGTAPGSDPPEPDRLTLTPTTFAALPGWLEDDAAAAMPTFLRSCAAWQRRGDGAPPLASSGVGGRARDWRRTCELAAAVPPADAAAARAFLESELRVYRVAAGDREVGLLTGYYEPTLRGSLEPAPGYEHPLYRRPPELVEVDLGAFRPDLDGRRIAGRVEGGRLRPYADREEIAAGSLAGRGLELVWVDDPVAAFFLHIQGSGRVVLPEGGVMRVGYAGQNGHPYLAIGRELVERGALAVDEVSMQTIRAWLEANPAEAAAMMARNPSFVFFRRLDGSGPRGSLGVDLTPERSLAVDRRFLPLGAPLWVETELPAEAGSDGEAVPWRRLMIAQDTGGAIRGPLRADLFWGAGERAAEIAGRMRQEGRLWLLLPRALEAGTEAGIVAGE